MEMVNWPGQPTLQHRAMLHLCRLSPSCHQWLVQWFLWEINLTCNIKERERDSFLKSKTLLLTDRHAESPYHHCVPECLHVKGSNQMSVMSIPASYIFVFLSRQQLGYILSYYLGCVTEAVHTWSSSWPYALYKYF